MRRALRGRSGRGATTWSAAWERLRRLDWQSRVSPGAVRDYARSEQQYHVYSLGGCRRVTPDGYIIGSFTDQSGSNNALARTSKVYFFKLRLGGTGE